MINYIEIYFSSYDFEPRIFWTLFLVTHITFLTVLWFVKKGYMFENSLFYIKILIILSPLLSLNPMNAAEIRVDLIYLGYLIDSLIKQQNRSYGFRVIILALSFLLWFIWQGMFSFLISFVFPEIGICLVRIGITTNILLNAFSDSLGITEIFYSLFFTCLITFTLFVQMLFIITTTKHKSILILYYWLILLLLPFTFMASDMLFLSCSSISFFLGVLVFMRVLIWFLFYHISTRLNKEYGWFIKFQRLLIGCTVVDLFIASFIILALIL